MPNSPSPRIHLWVPDYSSSHGGIQAFSRLFVRAVLDSVPHAEVEVMSKNDDSYPPPVGRGWLRFRGAGWWPTPYRTLLFAAQLVLTSLRCRPDYILITHANFAPLAWAIRSVTGIPYAVVAHGIEVWNVRSSALRLGLRGADRIWSVSRFTQDSIRRQLALGEEHLGMLPNTFLPEQFTPARKPGYLLRRYGLTPAQPVILTVARLAGAERYKGYGQILRGLPDLIRRVPGVRYILGGRGGDRARIEALIDQLGVRSHVTLAGFIPDHELEDHYNLCDVFAMPSKGEGFGIVFLEAMACGKPVLAGNQDGSVDPLLNGELGVLVDPDDVPGIARELELILTRRHPLAILQQPAELRRRVIEAYGYPRFVSVLAERLRALGVPAVSPV